MSKITREQLIEAVKGMTVLELSELVKALEQELGVTAAVPVAAAAAPTAGAAPAPAGEGRPAGWGRARPAPPAHQGQDREPQTWHRRRATVVRRGTNPRRSRRGGAPPP